MKLIHLLMKDFRQFRGEQRIKFSGEQMENVTVLHGFNGSGKTALLNSFVWCLYGKTTSDLEEPNRMLNEAVATDLASGENTDVFVEVKFSDHRGEIYVARRTANVSRSDKGKIVQGTGELSLGVHRQSGEYEILSGPQLYIDRHLPETLYPFFFFNGERVEKLAGKDAYDQVENGVKTLLNVEIFERAVNHLSGVVETALLKQLKAFGDTDHKDKVAEQERLKRIRSEVKDQITVESGNVALCEEEIEKIEQRQQSIVQLSGLIEKRRGYEEQEKSTKHDIARCKENMKKNLSTNGYLAFADKMLSKTQSLVEEARQKGDLPAKIKPQFVDDLLTDRICICGRAIEEGSRGEQQLRKWRESTELAELQEAILLTSGSLGGLQLRRSNYFDQIDLIQARQDGLMTSQQKLRDDIAELDSQIKGRSIDEESAALESQRMKAIEEKNESKQRKKEQTARLREIEQHLEACKRRIQELKITDKKGKIIKAQLGSVQRVASALDQICELQKQAMRRSLNEQVSEIWKDAAVKDYEASVSEGFRLELHKHISGTTQPVHGASTGEKQVLALSFVGALVKRAKENAQRATDSKDTMALIVGDDYPLVMDSPFGMLEQDYQRKIAEWIPTLAGQVVVMVSKSQWSPHVDRAFRERIGKEYVLELNTPKEGTFQSITILGTDHPYVVETQSTFEYTKIKEVS